ncbi:MAG TPA: type IV secretion system DNA-binding domain-containing protein [Verrucomicrobiota bacterium]|nr:type IV secretion system DNA-binding domain-containing protein [Verrucomicrobiota bacterium]
MKTAPSFKKITVEGSIQLGLQHELVQGPRRVSGIEAMFATRGSGPEAEYDAHRFDKDDALGEVLEIRFSEQQIQPELRISGAGLTTSFGIFGAPGSGKTVLLLHLLEEVLAHSQKVPDRRYGALILDPKAALIEQVAEAVDRAGRSKDLVVINTQSLTESGEALNVIDSTLDPYELGAILVLAGRSAGIDASDPFWFQEWSNLFASSLSILRAHARCNPTASGPRPVTLRRLLDAIFDEEEADDDAGYPRERTIQRLARKMAARIGESGTMQDSDLLIDLRQLERFYRQDYVGTIEAFVTKAFGMFRRSRLQCYSDESVSPGGPPFYEDIIENGRIVLVSISPSEPVLAKTLCTLIKCLFQRTVLARRELLASRVITNSTRPLVIACDEYSEIASEVPGQSMGDGQFLALAREYGCMALLATQSVNVLQASSLKETWKSVFSNFGAKIYMRLVDNETAEEATKLAGESDWRVLSRGVSHGKDGTTGTINNELRERKNLPSTVLTQVLKTGQAVVIGSLDGGSSLPGTYFLKVPWKGAAPKVLSAPPAKVLNA